MVNTIDKVLEHLLLERLKTEIANKKDIQENQYGYRKGRSTIDAIKNIVSTVEKIRQRSYQKRKICIMITFDVQNAFNSATWEGIIKELKKRNVSGYMLRIIQNYLSDRNIRVGRAAKMKMTCGVPQGSVLGPFLWNVYYDDILRIEDDPDITMVGYADDLAVSITGNDENDIKVKIVKIVTKIKDWMETHNLKLAADKTEAVLLVTKRKIKEITFKIDESNITTKNSIKYLGIYLDKNLRFKEHIKQIGKKAEQIAMSLSRIMPNMEGPKSCKRRTIATTINSTILYGAPIWEEALKFESNRRQLKSVHRRAILRVISGYRTISYEAGAVIGGMIPIILLVRERKNTYRKTLSEVREEKRLQ